MHLVHLGAFRLQESSEERTRQLKERLTRLFTVNERRVQRSVLYGADLLEACSVTRGRTLPPLPAPEHSLWSWVGRDACLKAQQNSIYSTDSLRLALRSRTERLQEGDSLIRRFVLCKLLCLLCDPLLLFCAFKSDFSLQAVVHSSRLRSCVPSALRTQPTAVIQSEAEVVHTSASGSVRLL